MIRTLTLVLAAGLFCSSLCFAGDKTVVLATLEWPPYAGEVLERGGVSIEVVRAAFKAAGYDLEVRFYPWNRAVEEALVNPEVMGYFPEYRSLERQEEFLFSGSIGKSPLGIAKLRFMPVRWAALSELHRFKIGIVSGYVNTEAFDRLVADGTLHVDPSNSDVLNLRKVLAGRIDLAVVDMNVFDYLMQTDALLKLRNGELNTAPQLLAVNDLFVCFRKGDQGEFLRKQFNEGLKLIGPKTIQQKYFNSILKQK